MIVLNLLPPKERKEISFRRGYKLTKDILILSLITSVVISVFLLIAKYIITKDIEEITQQNQTINQGNQGLNSEINKYNLELKRLSVIQKDDKSFLDIFLKLNDVITEGIVLSELSITHDPKDNSLRLDIKAISYTRENLIYFMEKFNKQDFVGDVELPFSTITKQNNIDFEISTKIFPDKINNN